MLKHKQATISITQKELDQLWDKTQNVTHYRMKSYERPYVAWRHDVSWAELKRSNLDAPMTAIVYSMVDYQNQTVTLFADDIWSYSPLSDPREVKAFALDNVAVGYLMFIYPHKKNIRKHWWSPVDPPYQCRMIDNGDLKKLAEYVAALTSSNGTAETYSLGIADNACDGGD
ncbi:MAG: hypothetical protein KGI60_01305 [Patescibacteria group bacterium]|nr:hypothetical protein [Patescibacteria group bacterium]